MIACFAVLCKAGKYAIRQSCYLEQSSEQLHTDRLPRPGVRGGDFLGTIRVVLVVHSHELGLCHLAYHLNESLFMSTSQPHSANGRPTVDKKSIRKLLRTDGPFVKNALEAYRDAWEEYYDFDEHIVKKYSCLCDPNHPPPYGRKSWRIIVVF